MRPTLDLLVIFSRRSWCLLAISIAMVPWLVAFGTRGDEALIGTD